jgi:hypothetical protein
MSDPLIVTLRYRKEAAEFSELAKTAETPFIRDYYRRLAQRYLMHAENEEKLARISEGFAADRHQDNQIANSRIGRVALGAASPEIASASPLPPSHGPVGTPRPGQRRRRVPTRPDR